VFDIAVDLRPGSATLGKWVGRVLNDQNKHMLWIPPGFGHAFLVLSDTAIFNYKCTDYYLHDDQHTLAWDDPAVSVKWPEIGAPFNLSQKDREGADFEEIMNRIRAQANA
jgi:dTDP-4-dehydrorhamnose 3,5-epimerase